MRKLDMHELGRLTPEGFKEAEKLPLILVLDNLRSLNNVGAAFRTADAFLAEKIYLCGITGTPPNKEIHKTALGATDTVTWEYAPETTAVLAGLRRQGYQLLALELTNQSVPLHQLKVAPGGKYALVFGHEVFGVSDEALALCDTAIEIPQWGTKHSLNVSVCMGIALWHVVQRLKGL